MRDPAAPPATLPLAGLAEAPPLGGRYRWLADLGRGGMGAVFRVLDLRLQVPVALKVLHPHLAGDPSWVERFAHEARLLASLMHPGIPAVHDLDVLPSGAPFYTMAEVAGEPLDALFERLPPRRRLDLVLRTAGILAHAHAIGVVHRDLSARNVLAVEAGEVRVVDWGLAARVGEVGHGPRAAGTPGYAAPEQRRGGAAGPAMDVYALGGLIGFAISGVRPHEAPPTLADPDLRALHEACRAPDPALRPRSAAEIVERLRAWFDGTTRRERAEVCLARAAEHRAIADARTREAAAVRMRTGEGDERVEQLEGEAAEAEVAFERAIHDALREDPALEPPHEVLVSRWMDGLAEAERAGNARDGHRFAAQIRSWRDGRYAGRLTAPVRLRVATDPVDAEVVVERFTSRTRRWEPEKRFAPGPVDVSLPPGSYRLRVNAPGRHEVLQPLVLRRGEPWSYLDRNREPTALWLPPLGELGPDDCYVPAGWVWLGGDPAAPDGLSRRELFVPGFAIRRFPVTVAEYAAFLTALAQARGLDAALPHVPRESHGVSESDRAALRPGPDGRFAAVGDHSERWADDWPVTLVDWHDARAFAKYAGAGWRLPLDLEWEKAARGADERPYAWGTRFDPAYANMANSRVGAPVRAPVGAFPEDETPYGVRGATGNVREWCLNPYRRDGLDPADLLAGRIGGGRKRLLRGGSWISTPMFCRLAARFGNFPTERFTSVGFRVVRRLGP